MNTYLEIKKIIGNEYANGEASAMALMLLEDVAGISRTQALMGENVDEDTMVTLRTMAERIANGEPLQYVTGKAEFCGMSFKVNSDVLIPRPETEELVEWIVDVAKRKEGRVRVLDIGTGSGCIAVSIAKNVGTAQVDAWDVSEGALRTARENAASNGVDVRFERVDVLSFDGKTSNEKYDIIVSNPPYICKSEAKDMERNVLEHEPHIALFVDDDDPLLFYRRIADIGNHLLNDGGLLFYEINRQYGAETIAMLQASGYSNIVIRQDQFGNDRMAKGEKEN
ncbi:MAG: peptide chain release factor N(5)-glutamine methyltransferase [Bacteroidaceae bacterium]|nr:peptide chain release factor N(5)-glutamine methyltransferase [Bacteroidaceae bacterium]